MRLFLSSIGFDEYVAEELDRMVPKKRADVSICAVVNAKKYKTKEEFEESVAKNTRWITDLGYSKIRYIDLDDYEKADLECDVLYIFGGNTFYLWEAIKRNAFDKELKRLLDQGQIIVGQSAGTIIFCPSIEIAGMDVQPDDNFLGMKKEEMKALGVVEYAILPHYEDAFEQDVIKMRKKVDYDICALKNGQTILVDGDKVSYLGGEPKMF